MRYVLDTNVLSRLLDGDERITARLERFAADVQVLPFDRALAARYAAVRAALERGGRPKSDFDLVVACTALEHGATLVTHDGALQDGFIPGLVVDDWLAQS